MGRVCFTLQVDPDRLAEYRQRHAAVWPEMLAALRDAGWHDYSLFLRDDGLLVGYFVADDLGGGPGRDGRHRGQRAVAGRDGAVLRRPAGPTRPGVVLDEVFNLDAQLTETGLNGVAR